MLACVPQLNIQHSIYPTPFSFMRDPENPQTEIGRRRFPPL